MAVNTYDKGALIKITAVFTIAGVATDPTTVTCRVSDPSGVVTLPTVVKDSVGNYHANVDLTSAKAGLWTYRWESTGACQAAEEAQFYVEQSAF